MTTYFGLYYPYLEFQSDNWLKVTALYWDQMGRIVPRNVTLGDSHEVRQLVQAGYVQNWDPSVASKRLRQPLLAFLDRHGENLARRMRQPSRPPGSGPWNYSQARDDDRRLDDWEPSTQITSRRDRSQRAPRSSPAMASTRFGSGLTFILDEKVDHQVASALKSLGLAVPGGRGSLGIVPDLGAAYMISLAEEMSTLQGAQPVADQRLAHVAASGFAFERLALALLDDPSDQSVSREGEAVEVSDLMLNLALQSLIPKDLDSLSVEALIKFRDSHASERGAFQERLTSFVRSTLEGLPAMNDPSVLAQHLGVEYEKTVKPELDALRKAMKGSKIDTIDSIANVQCAVPPVVGSIALTADITLASPVAFGLGVVFGALGLWNARRDSRRERQGTFDSSGVRYLYSVEKAVGPVQMSGSMLESVRRLDLAG